MARSRGTFEFPANLETLKDKPLDSRMLVDTLADLTNAATWTTGGNSFAFKGMMVVVANDPTAENNGIYYLANTPVTTAENWIKAGTGAGGGGASIIFYDTIDGGQDFATTISEEFPDPIDNGTLFYFNNATVTGENGLYIYTGGNQALPASWVRQQRYTAVLNQIGALSGINGNFIKFAGGVWTAATPTPSDVGLGNVENLSIAARLEKAQNLADLQSASTARNNLGLGSAAVLGVGTGASQIPQLDGAGKLPTSVLPALAITETFVVANQAAMLALSAQQGDVAIRTDTNQTFILTTNNPATLGDWREIVSPLDGIQTVNGSSGPNVTVNRSDETIFIAVPAATTYPITLYSSENYKIKGFRAKTEQGTCDIRLSIAGVAQHTGVTPVNSGAPLDGPTGQNWNVAIGNEVTLTVSNVSSNCLGLAVTIETGY